MKDYEGICGKYEGNMTEYVENMKEYVKNMKKYVKNIKEYWIWHSHIYMGLGTWKNSMPEPPPRLWDLKKF